MKYEISKTSRLWLSGYDATLLVHNPVHKIILGWFGMAIGVLFFIIHFFIEAGSFFIWSGSFLFLYGLISFGYKEFVVINPYNRMIKREANILSMCFYRRSFSWDTSSRFKYVISFNSLERISFISLFISSDVKSVHKFIVDFPEARAFYAFKKIFNKKFPEFEITETHKSKVEFEAAEVHRSQIKNSHNRVLRHKDHLL